MTSALKPMQYTTYYLLFLLLCEFITLFNLWWVERYTVQVAKEEEEDSNEDKEILLLKNEEKKKPTKTKKSKKKKKASKKIKLPSKDPDMKKLKELNKEIRKAEKRKAKADVVHVALWCELACRCVMRAGTEKTTFDRKAYLFARWFSLEQTVESPGQRKRRNRQFPR